MSSPSSSPKPTENMPSNAEEASTSGSEKSPTDELLEAIEHFKNAASVFLKRSAERGTLKTATEEAGRALSKVTEAAEPVAKQITTEISRLTRTMLDAVEGQRKSEVPPPPHPDTNHHK